MLPQMLNLLPCISDITNDNVYRNYPSYLSHTCRFRALAASVVSPNCSKIKSRRNREIALQRVSFANKSRIYRFRHEIQPLCPFTTEGVPFLSHERFSAKGYASYKLPSLLESGAYHDAQRQMLGSEPDIRPASSMDDRRFCGKAK